MTSYADIKKMSKEDKLKLKTQNHPALRALHEPVLKILGVSNEGFLGLIPYSDPESGEEIVSVLEKDLKKGIDLYITFSNQLDEILPESAKLWKLRYNPHYATEYKQIKPPLYPNSSYYYVPLSELIEIPKVAEPIEHVQEVSQKISTKNFEISSPKNVEKTNFSQIISEEKGKNSSENLNFKTGIDFSKIDAGRIVDMDARDFACMYLKVPESSQEWLNELIIKSRK